MAHTCSRCKTYIAQGRTLCDAHYQEALSDYQDDYAEYQAALEQYHADVEAWNAMSTEEKNAFHERAEEEALSGIGIFAGLIVGGGFWLIKADEIPWWLGAVATVFAVIVFYAARNLFSKLFRGFGYGIGYGVLFIGLGWITHWILNSMDPSILIMASNPGADTQYSPIAHTLLGSIGLATGLWKEFTGDHHAYGGPVKPIAPSRPSP